MSLTETGDAPGRAAIPPFQRRRGVRDLAGLPETLAQAGGLELKFAVSAQEVRAVQKMRYRVFFEEGEAQADLVARALRRDRCPFDRVCDHLIVVDHEAADARRRAPKVVGAYRVLRLNSVARPDRLYTAAEFNVGQLVARHPYKRFLELGRSCVLPEYRARRVLELLWRGVWTYVQHHRIDVMFGCASLPGADPQRHAETLSFLRTHAQANEEWRAPAVRAAPSIVAFPPSPSQPQSARRVLANLPPLVKGYLRLGAVFGDDVFIDRAFGTTDVFVVLPVANIDPRYVEHFSGAHAGLAAGGRAA